MPGPIRAGEEDDMPRPEKVQAVADIKERLEAAEAVFVAEYSGLSVKEQQQLRRGLRGSDSEFKVVKMTLARLAAQELGEEGLLDMLVGPTGLTFAEGDAAATAKVLRDFAEDHAALVIKGGLFAGEIMPPERVHQLADIDPRDVLLAKMAGAFQAPMAQMAGLMAALPRNLASMMLQLAEQKPPEAAPEPEAPAEEPAAEVADEGADESTSDAAPESAPAEAGAAGAAAEAAEGEAEAEAEAGESADDADAVEAKDDAAEDDADVTAESAEEE